MTINNLNICQYCCRKNFIFRQKSCQEGGLMARKGENIYKRKDGRWEGRYKVGYNEAGKAKYRSVYGKDYKTVRDKLTVLKSESDKYIPSGKLTVKVLFEEWLSAVKIRIKPSTFANYHMKIYKHILPVFSGIR